MQICVEWWVYMFTSLIEHKEVGIFMKRRNIKLKLLTEYAQRFEYALQ